MKPWEKRLLQRRAVRRTKHFSSYYREIAERMRLGVRETPQRVRGLAFWLSHDPADGRRLASLYQMVLRDLLAEFREDPLRPPALGALVERARVLIEEQFDAAEMDALIDEVRALTPRRVRRRSIHCHGQVADDRALLVLRMMLPTLRGLYTTGLSRDEKGLAFVVGSALAYWVADYDRDHFVMVGPAVASRFFRLGLWCQGNMPGDGLDSLRVKALSRGFVGRSGMVG